MEEKEEVLEEQKLKGRAAALAAYKVANPDLQEDPDDDVLHDFHGSRYSELEDRHNKLNEPNVRLVEAVSKRPDVAAFLSMIVDGENPKHP
jgi:hypothetical protein